MKDKSIIKHIAVTVICSLSIGLSLGFIFLTLFGVKTSTSHNVEHPQKKWSQMEFMESRSKHLELQDFTKETSPPYRVSQRLESKDKFFVFRPVAKEKKFNIDSPDKNSIITSNDAPHSEQSETNAINKLKKTVKQGLAALAFNVPKKMNIEDSRTIKALLDLDKTVNQLKKKIKEKGKKEGAFIEVSDVMEASLIGDKFDIFKLSRERQAVLRTRKAEWKWEIYPREGGTHRLELTVNTTMFLNGQYVTEFNGSYEKVIEVEVTYVQHIKKFVLENFTFILGTGFFSYLISWLNKKNKKKKMDEKFNRLSNP